MWKYFFISMIFISMVLFQGCGQNAKEKQLKEFIKVHVEKVKPLTKSANLAYWDAAIKGDDELYQKYSDLDLKIREIYSNTDDFALLKSLKESGEIHDPLLVRQLDVIYHTYMGNQLEPELLREMVELGTEIEKKFSNFRGNIKGERVSGSRIDEILKTETDSRKRNDAWLASKQVGQEVAAEMIRLVKLRNQAAVKLGFENYHTMALALDEQDVKEIDKIFEELYQLTNQPFAQLKTELDGILSDMYGVGVDGLMPWHYHDPFFQETPLVYNLDLDAYYKGKSIEKLGTDFYRGIGLPVESILKKSDLYEKEGKNPHAFCTDIDREGDVRTLQNLQDNERWMETMLHELGHAVYDKYNDMNVPWLLREPAHTFTTEAIAMFFGRLSRNPYWMQQMLGLTDEQREEINQVSDKYARLKQLIFARWAMVMFNFEKELYTNPDQDLNTLWWNLVEKYQLVKKPEKRNEPDWAAKIHFAIAPCYYHNYLMGELLASQLHHHIVFNVLNLQSDEQVSYVNEKRAGDFLQKMVFKPGAVYPWNGMITRATGEPLTARYFVDQFVK